MFWYTQVICKHRYFITNISLMDDTKDTFRLNEVRMEWLLWRLV